VKSPGPAVANGQPYQVADVREAVLGARRTTHRFDDRRGAADEVLGVVAG